MNIKNCRQKLSAAKHLARSVVINTENPPTTVAYTKHVKFGGALCN